MFEQVLLLFLVTHGVYAKKCADGKKDRCQMGKMSSQCKSGTACMDVRDGITNTMEGFCGEPQDEGCPCDSTLSSAITCKTGLSCQTKKSGKTGGKYKCKKAQVEYACKNGLENKWRKIGADDHDELLSAVRKGSEVKVSSSMLGLVNVQKVSIGTQNGNEYVYGQSLIWFMNLPGDKGFNIYVVSGSDGNMHLTSRKPGFNESEQQTPYNNRDLPRGVTWYIRDTFNDIVDEDDIQDNAEKGSSFRFELNNVVRPMEVISFDKSPPNGISIWGMTSESNGQKFAETEQWSFVKQKLGEETENASWQLNSHTSLGEEQNTQVTSKTFVDTCWRPVYKNIKKRKDDTGSISDLMDIIKKGSRVKVQMGDTTFETSVLWVDNENQKVIAQVYDNLDDNIKDAKWKWLNISTDGSVTEFEQNVGDATVATFSSTKSGTVWLVEDREWTVAAKIGSNGAYIDGSFENLTLALNGGADFRLGITRDSETIFVQADFVQKMGGRIYAYHDRHLELGEDVAQDQILHRHYSFIQTDGNVKTKIFQAEGRFEKEEVRQLEVTWFINDYQV